MYLANRQVHRSIVAIVIPPLIGCLTCASAEDLHVKGRVIDTRSNPVPGAEVAPRWRANGPLVKPDGKPYDLQKKKERDEFWGHVGTMSPFQPGEPVKADRDGNFSIVVSERDRALLAMDVERNRGGLVEIPTGYDGRVLDLQLRPLVTVSGRMLSLAAEKPIGWSHVWVHLAHDESRPLARTRLISCGSFDGRYEFSLPIGTYQLEADGISVSNLAIDKADLTVGSWQVLNIDGMQRQIEIGTLHLTLASGQSDIDELKKAAKDDGRWRDFTEHFGEPAPNWHAVDSRGIPKDLTLADCRGKWVLLYFWGVSCAPCLETGIPKMAAFYERNAALRDRFEMIGVCIDLTDEITTLAQLDKSLEPIVKHAWKGKSIQFPIVLDPTFQTWERFGIPGLGTVVLVDPIGNLVEGDELTLEKMLQM